MENLVFIAIDIMIHENSKKELVLHEKQCVLYQMISYYTICYIILSVVLNRNKEVQDNTLGESHFFMQSFRKYLEKQSEVKQGLYGELNQRIC